MAKRNIIASFIRYDRAHELKLVIYENKQGLRGSLQDTHGKVVQSAMFYEKDRDNTIYRVKEYFGFNENNSY